MKRERGNTQGIYTIIVIGILTGYGIPLSISSNENIEFISGENVIGWIEKSTISISYERKGVMNEGETK